MRWRLAIRCGTRLGSAVRPGLSYRTAKVQLQGARGSPQTYTRGATPSNRRNVPGARELSGRCLGWGSVWATRRQPFDEIAALIEQGLDIESLEAGLDVKPTTTSQPLRRGGRRMAQRRK